jgi:hypothetical protein
MTGSIPAMGSLNFRGKRLEITFDEFVSLDQVSEKFIISPPMKKKPQVYTKGKGIIVEFEEPLRENSTYTLFFQDAVRDLNEANILDNFEFVFSTGSTLDSLAVTGNVYSSLSLEVPEKTSVLLHRNLADSAVRKSMPDYISGIDQNGYFRISNVAPGQYRLYALADEDNSRSYNLETEMFAFHDTVITVTPERNYLPVPKDTVKSVITAASKPEVPQRAAASKPELPLRTGRHQLFMFRADRKARYLASSNREMKYKLNFILSLPPDSLKFLFDIPGAPAGSWFTETNAGRDSIRIWITDSTLYSQPQMTTLLTYPFTDSLGMTVSRTDTVPLRFSAPRPARTARIKKPVFTYESRIKTGDLRPSEKIAFSAATPFRPPDTSRIKLYELADSKRKKISYNFHPDPVNSCRYEFSAPLAQGKQYLLIADSASFGNIYGEVSDSAGFKFTVRDPESYNKLTLDISGFAGSRITQLLLQDEKVIGTVRGTGDGKVVFPLLDPGIYRLRTIYDLNSDGRWTSGDFSTGRQPEPVSYYGQEIDLKAGWNADNSWDITAKNFKDQKLRKKKENR